jgi:glycosyltransferase involved in cell wall biosynthesis
VSKFSTIAVYALMIEPYTNHSTLRIHVQFISLLISLLISLRRADSPLTKIIFVPLSLAIIIPTLNEAAYIKNTLTHVQQLGADACLVVDGGSHDHTAEMAEQHPCSPIVLRVRGGRAAQLNAAVRHLTQDVVVVLSADCRLSADAIPAIRQAVEHGFLAGCLRLRHAQQSPLMRLSDALAGLRARFTRGGYADQAPFFLRAAAAYYGFRAVGPYDTAELGQRVSKFRNPHSFAVLHARVVTSTRHWQRYGFVRGTIIHQRHRLWHWLNNS